MSRELSHVEHIKQRSRFLRGSLLESLADNHTGAIREDDTALIKFHGSYQQDDRDLREERRQQKLEPAYSFMIRTRTPGGVVTPEQWLALDAVAMRFANHSLRLTTRQAFQFHGVIKRELKATLQAINASLIDTVSACGDVNRNVLVSANPLLSQAHAEVHDWARRLSLHLKPSSRAYSELWLDEERIAGGEPESEPLYGETYLPRKFKIAFAIPPDNDVDVFAHDLGFIAVIENGVLAGFNVSVGGGMGATHGDASTYPLLGHLIGFVTPGQLFAVAEAVLTSQRDFGNREQRKHARLKYTIEKLGLDAFRREVESRAGFSLAPLRDFRFDHNGDRFGWREGHDGRWHLTLRIEAGRIADKPDALHLTGLREIAIVHTGEFRLTPNQNLVIANVGARQRGDIDAQVQRHGLDLYRHATPLRLNALACVALPTCGLAMAEAERYLPELLQKVEGLLKRHGLSNAPIHLRISGCPNGCSRPYLGEIALVGKAPGRYNLMLGADRQGQRLNALYRENIDETAFLAALDALFADYAAGRESDEGFGDFLLRRNVVQPARNIAIKVIP
ncbi:MAG: assimilatory sulfite reductase (NADPH) hemoprotein subunit [Gammaproteobacteria bacterium]|nr:MAG: assimilatory sulfite reductase (NADPH) hemoprotein subunit [Gammaproteobacteria bacterium]